MPSQKKSRNSFEFAWQKDITASERNPRHVHNNKSRYNETEILIYFPNFLFVYPKKDFELIARATDVLLHFRHHYNQHKNNHQNNNIKNQTFQIKKFKSVKSIYEH